MRRSVLSSAHQSPLAPPLRLVSMTWRLPGMPMPARAEMIARPKFASPEVELKFDTLVKKPSAYCTPAARSRLACSPALFQVEWPPSRYTLALGLADLMVWVAVVIA